jgi:hypothetical protein
MYFNMTLFMIWKLTVLKVDCKHPYDSQNFATLLHFFVCVYQLKTFVSPPFLKGVITSGFEIGIHWIILRKKRSYMILDSLPSDLIDYHQTRIMKVMCDEDECPCTLSTLASQPTNITPYDQSQQLYTTKSIESHQIISFELQTCM